MQYAALSIIRRDTAIWYIGNIIINDKIFIENLRKYERRIREFLAWMSN